MAPGRGIADSNLVRTLHRPHNGVKNFEFLSFTACFGSRARFDLVHKTSNSCLATKRSYNNFANSCGPCCSSHSACCRYCGTSSDYLNSG